MYTKLFSEIDRLSGKYLNALEDICNIESPTNHKAGVDAVGDYCRDLAKGLEWDTEVFHHEVSGDTLLITMNESAEGKPVVLSAHMDTVHPLGAFGYPAVRRDESNMYGPGVLDCKGGAAAALLAMHALKSIGFTSRPIKLFLQSDEENSSITSDKRTVAEMCEIGKDAVAFLNLEGYVKGTAVLIRKGILSCRFDVRGEAIHSARCAYGKNALAEAAAKILELEKMKDVEGITCSCNIISGGTARNTVPGLCTFYADARFANSSQLEALRAEMKRIAETAFFVEGTTCDLTETSFRSAMPITDRNLELLEKMNSIYESCGLPRLEVRASVGGSDAAYVTEAGIPCVDNLGTEGGSLHSVNEFIRLSSLSESAKRIASVIYYI